MAFLKKIWKDRVSEHPSRRLLTNVETNEVMMVDVTRAEGEIKEEGQSFSSDSMNDLENRIEAALGKCEFAVYSDGAYVNYISLTTGQPVTKKLGEAQLYGTAVASDVRAGKTFYNTSSASPVVGTNPDYSGDTLNARTYSISGGYITLTLPNNGIYSSSSKVRTSLSNYSGDTVNAKNSNISNGYITLTLPYSGYYSSSSKVRTSMEDYSGKEVTASNVSKDDDYTYFKVPNNGYYNTSSYIKTKNENLPIYISKISTMSAQKKDQAQARIELDVTNYKKLEIGKCVSLEILEIWIDETKKVKDLYNSTVKQTVDILNYDKIIIVLAGNGYIQDVVAK